MHIEDGICTLCKIHDRSPRFEKDPLGKDKLLEKLTSRASDNYDCVVPVSGGKDSTYALFYVVKELGLKPLAVSADSGFVVESAMENIENICEKLSVFISIARPLSAEIVRTSVSVDVSQSRPSIFGEAKGSSSHLARRVRRTTVQWS